MRQQVRLDEKVAQLAGQLIDRGEIPDPATAVVFGDDFAGAADVVGENRDGGRHRFKGGIGKTFILRRYDQEIHCLVRG